MASLRLIGSRLLRRLPGSKARGFRTYWRDMDRLAQSDIALVSFPKSGRTFVRVMLARLFQWQFGIDERELLSFATLRRAPGEVPRILFTHAGGAMHRPSQMRLDRKAYRGRKVAVLVRHPGDIVVSRYYHLRDRTQDPARQRLARQPLEDFVWTELGGVPSIVRFLNLWAEFARDRGDILIVRYEDFVSQPEPTLRTLAEFVGLQVDQSAIKEAVEFGSFDNLKQKEREGYFSSTRMGPGRAGNESSYKVRSGRSGGYRAQLSEEGQARVHDYVRTHLDPVIGYQ